MTDFFSYMLWPMLACFVLVGIHAYLGIHVIARQVIFVDLALAQIAALGAVYGVFVGISIDSDPLLIKLCSVIFTLIGAIIFSFTRSPHERVQHEAIIGIIYAVALSLTIVLTANLAHGADEVNQLLAGNILWVTPKEVIYTALLYACVGILHFVCRHQFFSLSHKEAFAKTTSLKMRLWDFLFYASFGIVVTSSVSIGGVLLVFGFLVIPSVIGLMLAERTISRLLIAWAFGLAMSALGVILSQIFDLPSGPSIVVLLGLSLAVIALIIKLKKSAHRQKILLNLLIILLAIGALIAFPAWLSHLLHDHDEHAHAAHINLLDQDFQNTKEQRLALKQALSAEDIHDTIKALKIIKDHQLAELVEQITPLLKSSNDSLRLEASVTLATLNSSAAIPALNEAIAKEQDPFITIEMAEALVSLGQKSALTYLIKIVNESPLDFAREDALTHLRKWLPSMPAQIDEAKRFLKSRDFHNEGPTR